MWARKIHDEWSKDYEGEQRKPKRGREETREEIRDIRESGALLSPNGQLWVMQKLQTVDRYSRNSFNI